MPQKAFRNFVDRALRWPMKARYYRLLYELSNIFDYQESFLLDTVYDAVTTEYGKKHNFHDIASVQDYQSSVPLCEYTDLRPFIEKMMTGKDDVLTINEIKRFAKTSGTTGSDSKYIPVTSESLSQNHFKASKDFLSMYLRNNPQSNMLKGLGIVLSGGTYDNPFSDKENVGFISAILTKEKPRWGGYFTALGKEYSQITDRNAKMQYVVEKFYNKSITSISGVGPWIVMLGDKIKKHTGKEIHEVWPYFELVLSGGVMIDLYLDQYKEIFGDKINVYNMYNSSEGFYGFQNANKDHSLLLATTHAIFYEFIPMDNFNGVDSKTLTLDQVEAEVDYAMVITNNAGLWRYITGDTVRFVSLNPFKLIVSGRTKYYLNVFDEMLVLEDIIEAIKEVEERLNCKIKEYTLGPKRLKDKKGCHEWIIEFSKNPKDPKEFAHELDVAVKNHNGHYAGKRANDALIKPPIVHHAPKGLFYQRFEKNGRLGGQSKVPNLRNDRKYIDELLNLINSK